MRRWRVIGLAGCVLAAVVVLVLALGGRGDSHAVPEGGSSFRSAPAHDRPKPGTGLLDALAGVLQQDGGAPAATTTAVSATTATAPSGKAAGGALPTTQARAAARLFLVGFGGTEPTRELLARMALHEWGGIVLEKGNGVTPQQVAGLVRAIHDSVVRAHDAPPLMAASMPGGDADAVPLGAPLQSEITDAKTAQRIGAATGKALRALGIRMALAPLADLGIAGGPWEGRAYSDQPRTVGTLAAAALAGYKSSGVAAAPGHFPGEGSASADPSLAPATVGESMADLRRLDLAPFRELAQHAPAIELSSATYVAFDGVTPATLLPQVVRMLRGELRFRGVIVSGDLAGASLATGRPVADLAVDALKACCDLLWIPGDAADQDAAYRAVVRALRTGDVPASRVAEALTRISVLRARYGVR